MPCRADGIRVGFEIQLLADRLKLGLRHQPVADCRWNVPKTWVVWHQFLSLVTDFNLVESPMLHARLSTDSAPLWSIGT